MKKIVTFGEIMLRLTPPNHCLIKEASSFEACYGGSEANVAIALSSLGENVEYITGIPNNALGESVIRHLSSYRVSTEHIIKGGDILGSYFYENGFGCRAPSVLYNRKNSAVCGLSTQSFSQKDYDDIFDEVSIFHISGISFALSDSLTELCFELMKQAKRRNVMVSFDFNYRSKLWSIEDAKKMYNRIIRYVDILFCSSLDLREFLDTTSDKIFDTYNIKYLVVRERNVIAPNKNGISAQIVWDDNGTFHKAINSKEIEFEVFEKIGSGDAFDAGVLHILNHKPDICEALRFGLTCLIAKHTIAGDALSLTEQGIRLIEDKIFSDTAATKIDR